MRGARAWRMRREQRMRGARAWRMRAEDERRQSMEDESRGEERMRGDRAAALDTVQRIQCGYMLSRTYSDSYYIQSAQGQHDCVDE